MDKIKKNYDLYEKFFMMALALDDIEREYQMELEYLGYNDKAFIEVYNTLIDLSRIYEENE